MRPYLCPADSPPPTFTAAQWSATGQVVGNICDLATASYPGMYGIGEPGVDGDGVFYRNSRVGLRDVTDGRRAEDLGNPR